VTGNPLKRIRLARRVRAAERPAPAQTSGPTIATATERTEVTLRGWLSMLTLRPRGDTPWLEAELRDASAPLTLIWMGRLAIPGINPGREILVRGRVCVVDGQRRMYNPYYELLS
jgi:hypothetical protein